MSAIDADAPGDGYLLPLEAAGVSAPVPFLVMGKGDLGGHAQAGVVSQDAGSRLAMRLHQLPLLGSELARLAQDVRVDVHLAHVVHLGRIADRLDLPRGQAHLARR